MWNFYIPSTRLLRWSFLEFDSKLEFDYLQTLYCSNFLVTKMLLFLFYGFNIGIVWDLVKSMKSPFSAVKSRHKFILIIAFISCPSAMGVFWVFEKVYRVYDTHHNHTCGDYVFELMFEPIEVIFVFILCLYSTIAIFIIVGGLVRKGLNKQIKFLFLKRQISFFAIVIVTQLFRFYI